MTAPHVAVVGAGAFGGWTALALRRRGARVTLIDAWGPGHTRASSGGETRVIRATYGSHRIYTTMAARAMETWRAREGRSGSLFRRTGVLWLFRLDDGFADASARELKDVGLPVERLSVRDAAARFPQMCFDGIVDVLWEPEAGYAFARRACEHVVDLFVREGGEYRQAAVTARVDLSGRVSRVALTDGSFLEADAFVFACGPWLGRLFPDAVGDRIRVTRQEVYYFGTPAGDARFSDPAMPVWLDYGERMMYGIPGNGHRGFKVADDTNGPAMDPTTASREPTTAGVAAVRQFLAGRFPALADAPLVGSEVCQYESTPDAHFLIDRHPRAANVWIAGGGSGHGFKMGPVVGEILTAAILDGATPDRAFSLARLAAPPVGGWQPKWA